MKLASQMAPLWPNMFLYLFVFVTLFNKHQQRPTPSHPPGLPPVYDWNVVTPTGSPVVHHRVVPIDCDQHCADRICTAFVVWEEKNHFKNGWRKKSSASKEYSWFIWFLGGAGLRGCASYLNGTTTNIPTKLVDLTMIWDSRKYVKPSLQQL